MILPEIITVGIYDSRIVAKNTVISKNRKTSMFEIELPIENGGVSYIDSNSAQINTNMLICAKPGQVRHTKFPFKCYYIHMIIKDSTLYNELMNTPSFLQSIKNDKYAEIFKSLIKYHNTLSQKDEIILQSLVFKLIHTIINDSNKTAKINHLNTNCTTIENSLKYIKENLTEDLSLENVAEKMSLSPVYFHNIFKKSVGMTLRDYVEEQRLKKAINLLTSTNYSLTQIAYECGLSSQSYFSYVFKRRMKTTPRDYVKEIYNKYEI